MLFILINSCQRQHSTASDPYTCYMFLLRTQQINVTNVNEPPTGFLLLSAATVPENTPKGSFVGDVVAEDPDAYQDHTFRVLGVAAGIE